MNDEHAGPGKEAPSTILLKKEIIPFEQDGPVEEPLFTNHCLVAYHAGIVYVDVGVLPLDEVTTPEPPKEVRFLVLNRLVMSMLAAKNLRDQLDELLARTGENDAKTSAESLPKSWGPAPFAEGQK